MLFQNGNPDFVSIKWNDFITGIVESYGDFYRFSKHRFEELLHEDTVLTLLNSKLISLLLEKNIQRPEVNLACWI